MYVYMFLPRMETSFIHAFRMFFRVFAEFSSPHFHDGSIMGRHRAFPTVEGN